ncbi:YihY/virulence factor BrkB family protein [Sphingomonas sp. XMGL2]|uniref:YihY/virulence factor BrkB family protein n=2 Tax=Sphingomonas quercus TaxID=2842451 RepID=A0ABS6BEM0_9SPHN|nr:YihY/virulence factor BrkB family protein [Sphingomonas quercus]
MEDNIGLAAAGVAFYVFLAIVPLLTAIVLTYGIFAEPATVIRHMRALTEVMPAAAARSVGEQLMTVVKGSDGRKGAGLIVAIAVALFGARNGAGALVSALNIAYDEKETRSFLRINLIALTITVAGAVGAILAALSIAGMTAIGQLFPSDSRAFVILGTIISYALLTLVGAGAAGALYRYAPCRARARWVWISPGSILAGLLWLGLTLGFGTYVSHIAHYDASYGSLGAAIGLLSWMYLSGYVLLFGAELNSELDQRANRGAV